MRRVARRTIERVDWNGPGCAIGSDGLGVSLTINQSTLSDNSANTATYPYNGAVFVGQGGAVANYEKASSVLDIILQ